MARPQEINEAFLLDTASTPATAMQLQQLAEQLRGGAKPGVAAGAAGAAAAATGSPSVPGVVSIGGVPATQQGFALPAGGAGGTTMSAPRAIPQLQGSLPPLTGQGTRPVAPSPTVPLRQLQQQPLQPQQQQQQQQQPQQPQRVSPLASRETLRAFIDHVSSSPEALQMQGQLFLEFTSLNKTALAAVISGPPVTEYYREYVARLTAILGSDKLHSVVSSFAPRLSAATAAAAAAGNAAATAAATAAAAAAANVGGSSAAGMVGQKRPLPSGSTPGTPLAPIQARPQQQPSTPIAQPVMSLVTPSSGGEPGPKRQRLQNPQQPQQNPQQPQQQPQTHSTAPPAPSTPAPTTPMTPLRVLPTASGATGGSKSSSASGGQSSAANDVQSIKDLTDVTRIANIDLKEEQERFIQDSQTTAQQQQQQQIYSVEDVNHLVAHLPLLRTAVLSIAARNGIQSASPEYVTLLSHALHERMRSLLEQLVVLSRQRVDLRKQDFPHLVSSDVRRTLRNIEKLDREAANRRAEEERLRLEQEAKSGKKKDKSKAKASQELEEQNTNVTALHAVGDVRLRPNAISWLNPSSPALAAASTPMRPSAAAAAAAASASATSSPSVASSSNSSLSSSSSSSLSTSTSSKPFRVALPPSTIQNPLTRLLNRSITKRDMLALLERERSVHMANSRLLFKTYAGLEEHRRAVNAHPKLPNLAPSSAAASSSSTSTSTSSSSSS